MSRNAVPVPRPDLPPSLVDRVEGTSLSLFAAGFSFPFRAVSFLLSRPALWPWVAIPAALNVALFVVGVVLAGVYSPDIVGWLWDKPQGAGFWAGVLVVLWSIMVFLLWVLLVTLTFVVVWALAGILATPFIDFLSEQVEAIVLGPAEEPFSWKVFLRDVRTSVVHSVFNLGIYVSVMVPLLIVNLIPVAGSAVFTVLSAVATSFFLARDMLDGPLTRRRITYLEKFTFLFEYKALMLGLGAGTAVLLWIPLLNFLCLPVAMTGGALLYCRLELNGQIKVPDRRNVVRVRPG